MNTQNLSTLKIHKLTKAQYERELELGRIDETALYLTPDEEADLSDFITKEELDKKADSEHEHDDRYYTETEIDAFIGGINASIGKITAGSTPVKEATHADSADNATYSLDAEKLGGQSPSYYATANSIPSGTLANKDVVTEADLDAGLTAKVNAAAQGNHSHSNKNVLDTITSEKVSAWDSAEGNVKAYVDGKVADLLNNSTEAVDSIMELAEAMSDNADAIGALTEVAASKVPTSRTINGKSLSSDITLSADDIGADAKGSASAVQTNLDALNDEFDAHTGNSDIHFTDGERTKLAGIASGAEVNQNAFSNVIVGSTTIAADNKTDSLTLVAGNNVTITPDATNDTITISAKDTTYNLGSFGLTATAAELNYCDGVTSNIQTQLNNKYGYGSEMGTNSLLIGTGGGWIYNSTNDGNIYFRYKNSASDTDYQWANLQSMMNSINNHTHNFIAKYNNNTINSPANDTTANWGQYGSSFHFYTTLGMINNQPSQYGFLQTYGYADEVYQLWMAQPGASMYIRGGNASGWGTGWKKIIDSSLLLNSVTTDSNDYVPTAATAKYLYDQINTKYGAGSQPNFSGISLGNGNPYIYTENNNINYRWYWDGAWRYYSMEDIYQKLVNGAGSVPEWNVSGILTAKIINCGLFNMQNDYIQSPTTSFSFYVNNNSSDGMTVATNVRPLKDNSKTCGTTSYRWKQICAATTSISTSDRNQKEDFRTFDSNENYEKLFMDLKPTIFKFKDGESNRDHFGFVSQDVEESLYKYGFNDKSFAGFCKDVRVKYEKDQDGNEKELPILDENGNEQYIYSLRYSEFISLNTYMIQKLVKENQELKENNKELHIKNEELEARLQAIEKMLEKLNVAV